jgi:alkylation response protein AidB-like acyl-CoA dehydrogenase
MSSPDATAFLVEAEEWVRTHVPDRDDDASPEPDVAVFQRLDVEAERELVRREAAWQQAKAAAGYAALRWPVEHGGRGLDEVTEAAFGRLERRYGAPVGHELVMVTVKLVAPTLRLFGSTAQQAQEMRDFVSGTRTCCQLFSEPSAGSDLASLATRARSTDAGWVISGRKVWSSGAHLADTGLLLARTDSDVPKHAGITAFLLPLDTPGVDIRPIRQMSGGTSFCEVFLDDVVLPDDARVGEVGQGWSVALATLGFEREVSDGSAGVGGSWDQVRDLAAQESAVGDPVVRQHLARVFTRHTLNELAASSDAARRAEGLDVGAAGSLRKLQWVALLRSVSTAATAVLGESLTADTGRHGTFVWNDHVLGSVGYSVAGGTDEIQHTIIAERLLGLPPEPRSDKGVAWRDVPR